MGGWSILADPYTVEYEGDNLYAGLLAEKTSLTEKQERIIVVEIKSFINPSLMNDFQGALGQYFLYRDFLEFFTRNIISIYSGWRIPDGQQTNDMMRVLALLSVPT